MVRLTVRVPEGINAWYTGGDVFYKSLTDPTSGPTDRISNKDLVPDAVACLPRLVRGQAPARRLGDLDRLCQSGVVCHQGSGENVLARSRVMMIHPSSATDEQFEVANESLELVVG